MIDVIGVGANSMDHVLRIPATWRRWWRQQTADQRPGMAVRRSDGHGDVGVCGAGTARRYVGAVGSDEHGRQMRAELTRCGVDVQHIVESNVPSPGAEIIVDESGTSHGALAPGRAAGAHPRADSRRRLAQSRLVHVDDVDRAAALYACVVARSAGVPVTSDIEQASDGVEALIGAVTHPIFDHNAPAVLTGESDPERALRKLRRFNRDCCA
jgi:sugar/nucleoside kinase (ribokinase family)